MRSYYDANLKSFEICLNEKERALLNKLTMLEHEETKLVYKLKHTDNKDKSKLLKTREDIKKLKCSNSYTNYIKQYNNLHDKTIIFKDDIVIVPKRKHL
jgi:RNase P/RNase MRP subunit p30